MTSEDPGAIEPNDPLLGCRIEKYEVRKLIGYGGMGRVYEAWNPTISKRVAIKVLADDALNGPQSAARFHREAQATSSVESPFIVEIYDAGRTDDGRSFIVMELLRGRPLSAALREETRLPPAEVVRIATQVLRGLERAHRAGVVHRDLKPDNVFLVDRDPDPPSAKILDFGISKLTRTAMDTTITREGVVVGTAAYMSPEQAQGQPDVDARSDIWSVGAIMYECLTGRQPFTGSTFEQVIVRICTTDAIDLKTLAPDCPDAVARVVERCMRRDRATRFESASHVLEALGQAASRSQRPRAVAPRARDKTTAAAAPAPNPHVRSASTTAPALVLAAGLLGAGMLYMVATRPSRQEVDDPKEPSTRPPTTAVLSPQIAESRVAPDERSAVPVASDSATVSAPTTTTPRSSSHRAPIRVPSSTARSSTQPPSASPPPRSRGVATSLVIQHE